MTESRTGTRAQQHEIAIDASVEAVWKAITDGEELTRWFVEAAKVEPGVGGSFRISWDSTVPEDASSKIEVWEPNQKLRVALAPMDRGPAKSDPPTRIIEEYTIERRDGKTVLRLVESGVPNTPEWDGFYDGTNSGWKQFFRTLRHYLEHHPGQPRAVIKVVGKLPGSPDEGWAKLAGPSGLGFEPVAGKSFSTKLASGDTLSGDVVAVAKPGLLELTVREYGDAYFAHAMSGAGDSGFVYSMLSVFGKGAAEVEAIRAKWEAWMTGVLGVKAVRDGTSASC
jgi:uncharacterized protein YndB with AHSA1/START domain